MRSDVDLDGRTLTFPSAGKVTLIDVWSTSCAPCLEAMPSLEELWQRKQHEGLTIVGIATDDHPGLVQEFVRKLRVTYPNVVDMDGSLQAALRAPELPQTFLVDRKGTIRFARKGGGDEARNDIFAAVETLLKE